MGIDADTLYGTLVITSYSIHYTKLYDEEELVLDLADLRVEGVHFGRRRLIQPAVPRAPHHADDLEPGLVRVGAPHLESPAHGVSPSVVAVHHDLVHDRHERRVGAVPVVEDASCDERDAEVV